MTNIPAGKIIGSDDILSFSFIKNVLVASIPVCALFRRLQVEPIGTGFLIAPGLLLTNNHLIKNMAEANLMEIKISFEEKIDGDDEIAYTFELDTNTFITSRNPQKLDYTVVGVKETSMNNFQNLSNFSYLPLYSSIETKLGNYANIIHFPLKKRKQISFRNNKITEVDTGNGVLKYTTDTNGGSSGSPVFNDDWKVIALHFGYDKDPNPNKGNLIKDILEDVKNREKTIYDKIIDASNKYELPKSITIT